MTRGERRNLILENCPDEFREELQSHIYDIECELTSILDKLDITDISDLSNIEDARRLVDDLNDSLY